MRLLVFGIFHTLVLLTTLVISQVFLVKNNILSLTFSESAGLMLVEASILIALEILIISLISLVKGKVRKLIQGIFAMFLFPLSFILLLDYKFTASLGDRPTSSVVDFILSRGIQDMPILLDLFIAEMSWGIIAMLFISALVSAFLTYSSFYKATVQKGFVINFILIIGSFFFLGTASVTTCQLTKPSTQTYNQILKTPLSLFMRISSDSLCAETQAQQPEDSAIPVFNLGDKQISKLVDLQSGPSLSLSSNSKSYKKNIVMVTLESFRVDQLTPYNPDLLTTPFLASMAQQGMKVETAYANFPSSNKSLVSIHCGIPPMITNRMVESAAGGIQEPCLPSLLKPLGYNSAFFQTATKKFENRPGLIKNMGFDNFTPLENLDRTTWKKVDMFGIEERAMLKPIMGWVDQQEEPFLLSILTLSGHTLNNKLSPSFPKIQLSEDPKLNNYYNILRYVDIFLYELFSEFEQRQLLDDTIFIFTGDHGNHYGTGRHWSEPMETTLQIPLIIWDKTLITKPKTVTGLRQHTDILPTIIDLLNFKVKSGQMYGTSLLQDSPNEKINFTCKYNSCLGRTDGKYKFIYRYNDKKVELYDVKKDRTNQNNIIKELSAQKIKDYIDELKNWRLAVDALY